MSDRRALRRHRTPMPPTVKLKFRSFDSSAAEDERLDAFNDWVEASLGTSELAVKSGDRQS